MPTMRSASNDNHPQHRTGTWSAPFWADRQRPVGLLLNLGARSTGAMTPIDQIGARFAALDPKLLGHRGPDQFAPCPELRVVGDRDG
jgi:hypothetical protein